MGLDPKKMMEALAQAQQLQEEAASETVEASAGGGTVTVKANGAGEILEIKIAKEAIDPEDPEMLGDLVLAAVNEALRSAQQLMQSKASGLLGGLGGLGLPGM
ncbi:MAG: nucleoid-associated protein EbfC [Gaiellaceae bacterium]|jgi:DNA-binding YbaB/EbfC family protein|nr:nucleoid-associated protein EbfC [Gaiellaceae bacterium]